MMVPRISPLITFFLIRWAEITAPAWISPPTCNRSIVPVIVAFVALRTLPAISILLRFPETVTLVLRFPPTLRVPREPFTVSVLPGTPRSPTVWMVPTLPSIWSDPLPKSAGQLEGAERGGMDAADHAALNGDLSDVLLGGNQPAEIALHENGGNAAGRTLGRDL